MEDEITIKTGKYQCRHILTDGHRCASPCLRQEEFCYYHHTSRRPVENPRHRRSRRSTFHLPLPEDRSAIQSSIGEVLRRIASNDIDPRRAGLLLYGLQIASGNLPPAPAPNKKSSYDNTSEIVEEITIDPTHGPIAPRAEIERPMSSIELLLNRLQDNVRLKEADAAREAARKERIAQFAAVGPNPAAGTPETVVLPILQAASHPSVTVSTLRNPNPRMPRVRTLGRGSLKAPKLTAGHKNQPILTQWNLLFRAAKSSTRYFE